jgi:hypothetical protein
MKNKKTSILIILFLSSVISCKKDDNKKVKFGWTRNGSVYFYDQYKGPSVVKNYFKLAIYDNRFYQNDINASVYMDILNRNFIVKKGGLFGLACEECNFGFFSCSRKFEFLYTPNSPSLNQEIPQFGCGRKPDYNTLIVKIDTTISVPYGTFNTYVMQHKNGDKSYWNADNGIIMYEKVDIRDSRTILETFKLSRKE